MKKCSCFIVVACIFFCLFVACAGGFSQDANRIETAADSVLMLEIYDKKGNCIATGSGFVAFDSATLVTNYHVIDEAYSIVAVSDDGLSFKIDKVFCSDENADIAILGFSKVSSLQPLTLRADKDLMRGMTVVAIGSPIGIKNTVSVGNISSVFEEDGVSLIQFTAPISFGSSGGALFNDKGEVIGVTTGGLVEGQNINYAVNISAVKAMYKAWNGGYCEISKANKTAEFDYSDIYDVPVSIISDSDIALWTCLSCGQKNNTEFCTECGTKRSIWICECGQQNSGKFCGYCGASAEKILNNKRKNTVKEIVLNSSAYIDTYVDISELKIYKSNWIGKAYYITCYQQDGNARYYIRLKIDDYDEWDWKNGKGIAYVDIKLISAGGKIVKCVWDESLKCYLPLLDCDSLTYR